MAKRRQKVLVLYLANSALDSNVKGWSIYDGTGQAHYTTGDSDKAPYKTGLDALKEAISAQSGAKPCLLPAPVDYGQPLEAEIAALLASINTEPPRPMA